MTCPIDHWMVMVVDAAGRQCGLWRYRLAKDAVRHANQLADAQRNFDAVVHIDGCNQFGIPVWHHERAFKGTDGCSLTMASLTVRIAE